MVQKSNIQWTNFTSNPIKYRDAAGRIVWACAKVSAGCTHCYAEALAKRYGKGGPFNEGEIAKLTPFVDEKELRALLTSPAISGAMVFIGDMTDVFGDWVTDEMLDRMFAVFALRPDVTFQLLTKRPERMRAYLTAPLSNNVWREGALMAASDHRIQGAYLDWIVNGMVPADTLNAASAWHEARGEGVGFMPCWPLPNVWLGTSVENQEAADSRIPLLLQTPAAVRFISAEPLLGAVDLSHGTRWCGCQGSDPIVHSHYREGKRPCARCLECQALTVLDWVIVGGESGPGARPCDVGWIRSMVQQCQAAAVPVFVKQLGRQPYTLQSSEWTRDGEGRRYEGDRIYKRLKQSHGADPAEWPPDLRVRQFPSVRAS